LITLSVVSHGHGSMVDDLMRDLARCSEVTRVVLTINVPEQGPAVPASLSDRTVVLRNAKPKGFGANHNAAFAHCETSHYCVLNPDVRFSDNPFPALLACLKDGAAMCAPAVTNPTGEIEDSARYFPGFVGLLAKSLGVADGRYWYAKGDPPFHPEWVAGMFMLFSSADYAALGGFDEKYFLYYEDVDLCVRLWRSGRKILLCPQATAVHAAQRASHRQFRHLAWHQASMVRYFVRHWGRLPATEGQR
jgi:N-acetylglucosaminyl-diphospho-decaprenol L-rhamnosyltransferase